MQGGHSCLQTGREVSTPWFPQAQWISIKILAFKKKKFAETHKLILKFLWKLKGPRIAKTILKQKNR